MENSQNDLAGEILDGGIVTVSNNHEDYSIPVQSNEDISL